MGNNNDIIQVDTSNKLLPQQNVSSVLSDLGFSPISKKDLDTLMETYKNNISLISVVVEKENQVLYLFSNMEKNIQNDFSRIEDKIEKNSDRTNGHVSDIYVLVNSAMLAHATNKELIIKNHSELTSIKSDVSNIKNQIYVLYAMLGGIVLTLIKFWMDSADKYVILHAIAKKLGI